MDKNKELVQTFLDLSWGQGEFEDLEAISTENFFYQTTFTDEILTLSEYSVFISAFRKSMSDMMLHAEETMSEGDRVMTQVSFSGSINKPFYGLPATDKIIAFQAVSLWDIKHGKIASLNTLIDIRGIERQLNANLPKYPLSAC